jgi:hypothetical protein
MRLSPTDAAPSSAAWQEIRVRSLEKHSQEGSAELQIPPLRYAPVGMTKGRVAPPLGFDAAEDEQQVPPLRFRAFKAKEGSQFQSRRFLFMNEPAVILGHLLEVSAGVAS